jgi:hypothetical protein
MVMASRRPGKHSFSHTQYESLRKYRAAYSNKVKATPQTNVNLMVLGDDKGKTQIFVKMVVLSIGYSFCHGLQTPNGARLAAKESIFYRIASCLLEANQIQNSRC